MSKYDIFFISPLICYYMHITHTKSYQQTNKLNKNQKIINLTYILTI